MFYYNTSTSLLVYLFRCWQQKWELTVSPNYCLTSRLSVKWWRLLQVLYIKVLLTILRTDWQDWKISSSLLYSLKSSRPQHLQMTVDSKNMKHHRQYNDNGAPRGFGYSIFDWILAITVDRFSHLQWFKLPTGLLCSGFISFWLAVDIEALPTNATAENLTASSVTLKSK